MKKIIWIVAVVVIGLVIMAVIKDKPAPVTGVGEMIKIGAVLPLTGSGAILGEPMRNGIDLALKDKKNVEIIFEDSKALPTDGVTAYYRLIAGGVDAVISAYSGVSVPLISLAVKNKIPLIMSLVAADNVTNEYSYRYYATPKSYVLPAFTDVNSPLKNLTNIAVLFRNDEYGKSVSDFVLETASTNNKKVVISESYKVNETDFSTHLTKIKAANPEAVLFIDGTATEGVGILKKAFELKIPAVFIETSAIFSDLAVQAQAPSMTFYTTAFSFSLPNDNIQFKKLYTDTYKVAPNFAAAFGYDIANWITSCIGNTDGLQSCLNKTKSVDGITGQINNIAKHEINPPMFLVKVN
ncbi:MAG: ABC transporter substrate-binding protein [Patescibacteria group bacterium]